MEFTFNKGYGVYSLNLKIEELQRRLENLIQLQKVLVSIADGREFSPTFRSRKEEAVTFEEAIKKVDPGTSFEDLFPRLSFVSVISKTLPSKRETDPFELLGQLNARITLAVRNINRLLIYLSIKDAKSIPDAKTADGKVLRSFFIEVAPDHDQERVYASDMKKIISWFNLIKELPLFTEAAPEPLTESGAPAIAEQPVAKKPEPIAKEKPKATKAPAKSATRVSQKSK